MCCSSPLHVLDHRPGGGHCHCGQTEQVRPCGRVQRPGVRTHLKVQAEITGRRRENLGISVGSQSEAWNETPAQGRALGPDVRVRPHHHCAGGVKAMLRPHRQLRAALRPRSKYILDVPLDMKGCICHFMKWLIHPFLSKRAMYWF